MRLRAEIRLEPSFHPPHDWSIDLSGAHGEVTGQCADEAGGWTLSADDLASVPPEVRDGVLLEETRRGVGLDGIVVTFSLHTPAARRETTIWCPDRRTAPGHAVLLRWCWDGLYARSPDGYRVRLEQLHAYFADWGIPARRTPAGLRIFGSLSSRQEAGLRRLLDEVAELPAPEIDLRNFENTGTLLFPVFRDFFRRAPASRWLVNEAAERQMTQAGIPASAMVPERG